jgi:MraZ protein
MSDFCGSETVTLDAKGRLILPLRMRKGLAPEANDTFRIVQAIDPCVNIYPLDEWAKFRATLDTLKQGDDEAREFVRALHFTMIESTMDGSYRVTLTEQLIELGGLTKDVLMIGMGKQIELWDPKRFAEREKAMTAGRYSELARKFLS